VLAAHIAVRLAPHKRPRRIVYVASLPHTAAGKPDRAALAAQAGEPRALRYPRDN
jgi:O-succinylbenzoic acid--CoA ligase